MLRRVCTVATPLRHLVFQPRTVQIARFSSAKSTQAPLDDAALRAIAITASKSQSFSDAWRCYLALPQREHITLITYNALIRAAADCGNLPSALHLLSDMISNSKLTPTQSTLASLLHACSTTCLPSLVEACVKSPKSDAPTSVSSLISVWQQLPPEAQAQISDYRLFGCASRRGAWARCQLILFWFRGSLAPTVLPNGRAVSVLLSVAQQTRDSAILDQCFHLLTYTYRVAISERSFSVLLQDRLCLARLPGDDIPVPTSKNKYRSLKHLSSSELADKVIAMQHFQDKVVPPQHVLQSMSNRTDWMGVRLLLERARAHGIRLSLLTFKSIVHAAEVDMNADLLISLFDHFLPWFSGTDTSFRPLVPSAIDYWNCTSTDKILIPDDACLLSLWRVCSASDSVEVMKDAWRIIQTLRPQHSAAQLIAFLQPINSDSTAAFFKQFSNIDISISIPSSSASKHAVSSNLASSLHRLRTNIPEHNQGQLLFEVRTVLQLVLLGHACHLPDVAVSRLKQIDVEMNSIDFGNAQAIVPVPVWKLISESDHKIQSTFESVSTSSADAKRPFWQSSELATGRCNSSLFCFLLLRSCFALNSNVDSSITNEIQNVQRIAFSNLKRLGSFSAARLLLEMHSASPSAGFFAASATEWNDLMYRLAADAARTGRKSSVFSAFDLWFRMRSLGIAASERSLSALLRGCVDAHEFSRSDHLMASASDSLNRPTDSTDIDLLSLALSLLEHMSQLKMHPHRRTLIRLARLHAHLRVASAQTSSPSAVSSSTRPSGSVAVIRTAPQAALNEALRVFASKSAGNGLNGLRPGLLNHLWMYSAGAAFAPLSNRSCTLSAHQLESMRLKEEALQSVPRKSGASHKSSDEANKSKKPHIHRFMSVFRPQPPIL